MAASKISICNKALIELGESPITALTDNNKAARTLDAVYDIVLLTALRSHRWNFAVKRVALAELSAIPVYGFTKQYQLPSDCLRVLEIDTLTAVYKIEGRALLTDSGTVYLKYVAKIDDPTQYDAAFVDYLSLKLASDIAMTLTDNTALRDSVMAKSLLALREARTIDGQEDYPDAVADGSWITSRF